MSLRRVMAGQASPDYGDGSFISYIFCQRMAEEYGEDNKTPASVNKSACAGRSGRGSRGICLTWSNGRGQDILFFGRCVVRRPVRRATGFMKSSPEVIEEEGGDKMQLKECLKNAKETKSRSFGDGRHDE